MSYLDTSFSTNPQPFSTASVDGNRTILIKPPERCHRHSLRRQGCGPTGRKKIWVTVDSCRKCGMIVTVFGNPSEKALNWVRRWNNRIEREFENGTPEGGLA